MRKLGAVIFALFLLLILGPSISVSAQTQTPPPPTGTPWGCPLLPAGAKPEDYPAEWVAMCWQKCYGLIPTATHGGVLPITPIGLTQIPITPLPGTPTTTGTVVPTIAATPTIVRTSTPTPSGQLILWSVVNGNPAGGYNGTPSGLVSCVNSAGTRYDIPAGTSASGESYSIECLGQTTFDQTWTGSQYQKGVFQYTLTVRPKQWGSITIYYDADFQVTCTETGSDSGCAAQYGDYHYDGVGTSVGDYWVVKTLGVRMSVKGYPDNNPTYHNHHTVIYGYSRASVQPPIPTPTAVPTATLVPSMTPTGPGPYCQTLPGTTSSDPVVSALPLIYSAGPCPVTIIPSFSFDLPGFPPLWDGFHWSNDGLEICITWVDLGELKVLGWSMAGLLIAAPFVGWVIKLVSRGG
jgi:hypothetical protein